HPGGSIKAPHLEAAAKQAPIRIELFQTGHCMKAIDRDIGLAQKPIICAVLDLAAIKQLLSSYSQVKPFLSYLVRSPHADCYLGIGGELKGFRETKVLPWRDRTLILLRDEPSPDTVEDTEAGIAHEIFWQPANGKRFELPVLISSRFQTRRQLRWFVAGKDPNDGDE